MAGAGGLHAWAMDRAALLALPSLCALWAAVLSLLPCGTQGNWMWLGIASFGVPEKLGCADLPLNSRQKELCKRKPYLLPSIREGARLGIQECRSQFRHERWNCMVATTTSTQLATAPLFGYELSSGTKETAFIYAIMAAGLVHSVTRSCSAGNMTECSCDTTLQNGGSPSEGWHWGGCSDDVQYGMWFSRKFLDLPIRNTTGKESRVLLAMNLHNNEAGRQVCIGKLNKTLVSLGK